MLNQVVKDRLFVDSGVEYNDFIQMSPIAEKKVVEDITHHQLSVSSKRDYRRVGRGNPLIARRRIRTIEDVDKGLSEIKWDWTK